MPTLKKENNPTPMVLLVFLMGLGIFTPPISQADIYTWIDADGVRHFTNKPPPGDVMAARHSEETPYDAEADRINQAAEERGFAQRAQESVLRRLAETDRALAESQYRAQAAERRTEDLAQAYDYDYDYPYDGGTSYGGDVYADYDRRDRETRDRRGRRHRGRAKNRDDRPDNGDHIAAPLPERNRRDDRVRRRPSKRERGVSSGLTRVVRAVPSPYYMGYRPVYTRDASYKSRRGRHSGAGGSRRSGGRARVSF